MSEPLAGIVVPSPANLPALPPEPDARPYVAYLTSLKSTHSQRAMRECLDWIAAFAGVPGAMRMPWHALRYEHTSVIRAKIMEQSWSPAHKNKHLSAMRGVIRQCWKLGLITADERDRACSVESDDGKRLPAGRNIHEDEISALLSVCLADENTALGTRDAALLTLLYRTGIRREEAATALIERYDPAERKLRVIGKRDKERKVFIPQGAVATFERWLAVIGSRRGAIFRPVDRWGNIAPRAMSTRAVGRTVSQRQAEAGLQQMSTHDFRRTFGGDFLDAGGDLVQLQQLMGHASATTTASYDRRDDRSLRDAVDHLKMPAPRQPGAAK